MDISPGMIPIGILYAVWAVILFGGYLRGFLANTGDYSIPTIGRIGSSAILVCVAWLQALVLPSKNYADVPWLLAIGMICGLMGDIFLADFIPTSRAFIFGMASFAIGHIWYIAAFWQIAANNHITAAQRFTPIIAWLFIAIFAWYAILIHHRQVTLLNWLTLPYALLLAGTASVTLGAAFTTHAIIPAAIGATLFLISDMLIAAEKFAGLHFHKIGDTIWLTYGPAQALIIATPLVIALTGK